MNTELYVHLDGERVGTLAQTKQGNTTFAYDERYRLDSRSTPLSLSMPLARREHPSRVVTAFLQGLLTDSPTKLAELAATYQTSARNAFGLLAHVGPDAAGAAQILPPDETSTDAATRQGGVERLSDAEFSSLINDIVQHSDTWGQRGDDARWSLPGAQPKVALFRFDDGGWGVPNDSTPTTHILKPAIAPYSNHDVNEYVTMRAARLLGLNVADHELTTTEQDDRVFVSRRYDRRQFDGRWARLHQEALCQALSVPPDLKYQQDGGPGVGTIAQLLGRLPLNNREAGQKRFFDSLVFNVSAACTDAHAKNISILLRGDRAVLAPLYDLGTHAPYPATGALRSAMKVGDEYRMDAIGLQDFLAVAAKLQIPADYAEERVRYIRGNVAGAFADAAGNVSGGSEEQGFATTVSKSIFTLARERGW
ncbi:HipA domain-containing protein [Cryobacterium sp. N19]|uniref:HipA domain-containing protein n=1 Tax=Cryobacterium sp. N19 TaxID=2048288 RepID=UPI000CE34415|nr:HipA domain-containing protein [Cryobacterium sp. N19]